MPAFDKNSVLVEHAYKIDVKALDDEGPALQPCPRCGNKMHRKHRLECPSCRHMVSPIRARVSWQPLSKNAFADALNSGEKETKNVKFKLTRLGKGEALRALRQLAIVTACLGSVIYSIPLLGKAALGEKKFDKVVAEFNYLLAPDIAAAKKVATNIKNFF